MASKKDLSVPDIDLANAGEKARLTAKRRTAELQESVRKGEKKPAADYIKLDLKPKGGADFKGYILKQASKQSLEQGKRITVTGYIQSLIEKDMLNHSGKRDKRQEISDMLNYIDDKDLNAVETILKGLCK